MKLTKKDKEFLSDFAVGICANTLISSITANGEEVSKEAAEAIVALLNQADLTPLTSALQDVVVANQIDVKRLIKVDKYFKTTEAQEAVADSQQLGGAVSDLVVSILFDLQKLLTEDTPEEV